MVGDNIKDEYIRQRARGAYIASLSQPEASFALSRAAQTTDPKEKDAAFLNKRLRWQMDNKNRGLRFIKLAPESLKLLVFVDGSFANNEDLSSQIGYVIVLANEEKDPHIEIIKITANIIH